MRAYDFYSKFGVNGGLDSGWNTTQEINDLSYLGLNNIRSAIYNTTTPNDPVTWAQTNAILSAAGIRQHIDIGPNETFGSMSSWISALKTYIVTPYGASMVTGVTGPNEQDTAPNFTYGANATGIASANAVQADLFTAMKADPALASIPVDFWPVGCGYSGNICGQLSNIGDQTAHCDRGNLHDYYSSDMLNQPTGAPYLGDIAQVLPRYLVIEQQVCNHSAFVTTESGWYTPWAAGDNSSSATENVQAKLLLPDLFDHASLPTNQGVYIFTLRGNLANNDTSQGPWYGVMHGDSTTSDTPKIAGVAIHNLMAVLKDSGANAATFSVTPFGYRISGLPTNGYSFLVAKSNGAYDILLWNETPIFSPTSGIQNSVTPSSVTITLPNGSQGNVYDPIVGSMVVQSFTSTNSVTVSLVDDPLIVEVGPAAVSPPPRFTGIAVSGITFTPNTTGAAVGTASPTVVNGSSTGTAFSIPSSGFDNVTGDLCPSSGPTNFAVNSSSGAVTTAASLPSTGAAYHYCLTVTLSGVSNTGFTRIFSAFAAGNFAPVQSAGPSDCSSGCTSLTAQFQNATMTGDAVIVGTVACANFACTASEPSDSITSVSLDGQGCTFVPGTYANGTVVSQYVFTDIWLCNNSGSGITGGPGLVTVTTSIPLYYLLPLATEWICGTSHCAVDTGLGNIGAVTGSSISLSTNGSTSASGDLIYSVAEKYNAGTFTPGQTPIFKIGSTIDEYQVVGASGSMYSNTYTTTSSGISGSVAAFKK